MLRQRAACLAYLMLWHTNLSHRMTGRRFHFDALGITQPWRC